MTRAALFFSALAATLAVLAGTAATASADINIYRNGSRWAVLEDDGDVYVNGSRVGQVESDGDVYMNGSRVGQIESDGDIYLNGSRWGQAESCCGSFTLLRNVIAVLIFFDSGYAS